MRNITSSINLLDVYRSSLSQYFRFVLVCDDAVWLNVLEVGSREGWLCAQVSIDDWFNKEADLGNHNGWVVIVRDTSSDSILFKYAIKFGYFPVASFDAILEIVNSDTLLNMSGFLRRFEASNQYISVGGRDDIFRLPGIHRSINVDVPSIPFFDPSITYTYTPVRGASSGQFKLQMLLWMVAMCVGRLSRLVYVGGSPGDNYSFDGITRYFSDIVVIDPRSISAGDEFSYIIHDQSMITNENFRFMLDKYRTECSVVVFDIRVDRDGMSTSKWQNMKTTDTLFMQKMADYSVSSGYKLASIKFWRKSGFVQAHPILHIPFSGGGSMECRTFQTAITKKVFKLDGENLKNYCSNIEYDAYSDMYCKFDFISRYWGFGALRADACTIEYPIPYIVFDAPSCYEVDRSEKCFNPITAFFVVNQMSDLTLFVRNAKPIWFTQINVFSSNYLSSGFDNSQRCGERAVIINIDGYVTVSFGEFCYLNGLAHEVMYNSETESISFYVRLDRVMHIYLSPQTIDNTQTNWVRIMGRRFTNALRIVDGLSYRKFRYRCTRDYLKLYYKFSDNDIIALGISESGEFSLNGVEHSMSGHAFFMLVAASFGLCDITVYLYQMYLNLSGNYSENLYEPKRAPFWHSKLDYQLAVFCYRQSSRYGVPVRVVLSEMMLRTLEQI